MKLLFTLSLALLSLVCTYANPAPRTAPVAWHANWIALPGEPEHAYGVYNFRKKIILAARPDSFLVHVSADNRYKLFVNGTLVSSGPARNDFYHWNYATVDLAPYLTAGANVITAIVWNESDFRPEAQFSVRTAFMLQGHTSKEEILNSNESWKCTKDNAYHPLPGYFAASCGELVDRTQTVRHWMDADYDDNSWPAAANLFGASRKGQSDGLAWMLVPCPLPPMEMTYQRIPLCRKAEGITAPENFPAQKKAFTIPAHTTATLLLDQTFNTNAYVTLQFSKGAHAGISLHYAEALKIPRGANDFPKGNRNEIEGKVFHGRMDSLISDGTDGQSYTNLNFRTFRYIQLLVHTQDEPLTIDDIYGTFTGYPFAAPSQFHTDSTIINQILDIGWRTARLNAWETYTDCPYYEQLQYIGDTRVQATITYYNSADDRLARNALELMDHSRLADGYTFSRYPSRSTQIISTFSLWYIGMLHDYWMYRGDDAFIAAKLHGARGILDFFHQYQDSTGSLKHTPFWTFVDWAGGDGWFAGAPPTGADGSSAILDLQLLMAYQWEASMERKLGAAYYAALYEKRAAQLKQAIQQRYWSAAKGLYADTPEKNKFSQHANSLAILAGMFSNAGMRPAAEKMLADNTLTQCTIYFKYYLHQALTKAGMGDDYLDWLGYWRQNIAAGLTTWTEDSSIDYTRSDCHAWGSSPNIEFFRTVLGIDSDAPGFTKVKITPHPGKLKDLGGEIPHPQGKIDVEYHLQHGKWQVEITLPGKTTGSLVWKGKTFALKSGDNKFAIQ